MSQLSECLHAHCPASLQQRGTAACPAESREVTRTVKVQARVRGVSLHCLCVARPLSHTTSPSCAVEGWQAMQVQRTCHRRALQPLPMVHFHKCHNTECITHRTLQGSSCKKETDGKIVPLGREASAGRPWHTLFSAWQS